MAARIAGASPPRVKFPNFRPRIFKQMEEVQLELTPVLLQSDTHKLTASPHAGFGEKLLQRCFYRTLGYSDSLRDFFIHQAIEYTRKNLTFSFGKPIFFRLLTRACAAHRFLQEFPIKPDLSSKHIADSLDEQCRRVVFHENSRNAVANQVRGLFILHSGSNDQDFAGESLLLRQAHELAAITLSEVKIKEHDVDMGLPQCR